MIDRDTDIYMRNPHNADITIYSGESDNYDVSVVGLPAKYVTVSPRDGYTAIGLHLETTDLPDIIATLIAAHQSIVDRQNAMEDADSEITP